ncbi:MAG: ribosomal-processing cysteine protease Prp [Velocimicrobium sp.]
MIEITVKKNEIGIYNGLCVKGHAGYDEYGKDIVCAAVSVLVINTLNSVETFTKDVLTVNTDEVSGLIEFEVVSEISQETRLLLDSLLLGLQGVKTDYGKNFIKIM